MFDQTSGLWFSESIVRMRYQGRNNFAVRCLGAKSKFANTPEGPGSLQSIAMRSVLSNLDNMGPDALAYLPPMMIKRIWEIVQRSNLDSIRTWQLFVLACPEDPPPLLKRVVTMNSSLENHLPALGSETFAWLTVLYLRDGGHAPSELMKLAKLHNLVCLHVEASNGLTHSVTDRVIRGWSHEAEFNKAFPRLQSIFLRNQPEITQAALQYLNAFPSFKVFCISRSASKEEAFKGAYGWHETQSDFIDLVSKDLKSRPTTAPYANWRRLVDSYIIGCRKTLVANNNDRTPILAVELNGRPHPQNKVLKSTLRDVSEVSWYERGSEVTMEVGVVKSGRRAENAGVPHNQRDGQEPSRKRLKLRNGKQQALDGMFGSIQNDPPKAPRRIKF